MSLIGEKQLTGSKGLVKKDYKNQKDIALGFKKLRALDKPGLGATGINLTALTTPTEATGFANPSSTSLAAAKLLFYKQNVIVKSSSKGELIQDLSYKVSSNTFIEFLGFTAEENEIFEIIVDTTPATGTQVVDAQPVISTGTLSAGSTEYNVGEPFDLNKYPTRQMGAVAVWLDGVLQFRNSSNAAAAPGADGNYHEKAAGGSQLATIIEFNEVDNSNDRQVIVMSTQGYAERPDGSMMALIEQLQATVDVLVEDAAAGFGNLETRYQPAPTQPDLKAFGDSVLQAEADIDSAEARLGDLEDPTQMSDVLATKLGHKVYEHGTTYAGGNAPTITLNASTVGSLNTVNFNQFIPYQLQDGSWRLKFSINVDLSSTGRTSAALDLAGVTAADVTSEIDVFAEGAATTYYGWWIRGTNTMRIELGASRTTTDYHFGGDIPLASKPTWAF